MNSRDPFFTGRAGPWANYTPGTHSVYSSPPRFPYSVPASRSHQGYVPGGVVYGPSPFLDRDHSPTPPSFGRSGLDHYSAGRWTSSASPVSRRRTSTLEDEDPDPVVFNAGVTFRLGREAHVHRHLDVQPAHTMPEAPSAALTRQIDKFLKKSDHALDRYSALLESRSSSGLAGRRGRSATPAGGLGVDSPDTSLSLRAQRSTSAASIAVKAEKHLESLGPVGRRHTGPIAEREEDDEDYDSSSSGSFDDFTDDTSDDLSKDGGRDKDRTKGRGGASGRTPKHQPSKSSLDDLSSDSDDEYFDVVPLPGLRPPPLPPPATSSAASPRQGLHNKLLSAPLNPPTHSRSLPAVNKGPPKRAMGNYPAPAAPTPGTDTPTQGTDKPPSAAMPSPKAPAPPPPTAAPLKTPDRPTPQPPVGFSVSRSSSIVSRGEGVKKYPAPQPPKDPKTTKDSKNVNDAKDGKDSKQEGEAGKPNKPACPETNTDSKPLSDSPDKASDNKANSAEAPPRPGAAITPASSGLVRTNSDADKAFGATSKPRRAPSFKKYPAPQPPAASVRPKSDGANMNLARDDILAASTGSVPSLLQPPITGLSAAPSSSNLSVGEKKSPDTQSSLSDGKGEKEVSAAKPAPQIPPEGNPGCTPSTRKVRAGSPVPEKKMLLSGRKAPAPPVVTGKLKIASSDSTASVKQDLEKTSPSVKVAAKEEDAKESGDKAASKSAKVESKELAPVEDKKIPNGDLGRSPSPEKTLGKKEGKQIKTTDTAGSSTGQQQDNTTKSKKAAKTETKPDKITVSPVCNGTQESGEEKASTDDKKHKKINGTHTEEDPASRSDACSGNSSVASDVPSPDASQKTYKRTRSGKLAGILNKFEVDEPPKASDKVKPKKVGKISGLASVFESGKDQTPSKPDLASLKSPEKKAPDPKPVSIAGITTSKFGGVAKFKKPPGDTKKEESKPSSSEDTKKSNKESAKKKDEVNGVADKTEVKKTEKTDKNDKEPPKKTEEMNGVAENTDNNKDKKVDKKDKETKKKDELNGFTDNKTENKTKTKSEEKTEKSDKETKKIEVNGVINETENKIKTASEEKTEKSNKETKKIEVNGVAENTDISVKPKKPFGKKGKINKESSLEKKDQVNGLSESCENDQENKKPPDKTSKDQSVRKKDYVNGHIEGMENNLESKTQSVTLKTEKTSETTPSAKNYMNGITESVGIDGAKKARKPESEIDTPTKAKEKPEAAVKEENTTREVPQALTNGDLGSDESSLSSASEIEVKSSTTATLGASVTAAAAGRGEMGQGARPKVSVKPLPAKEGDTESKINLSPSDSVKGTKDSMEKEAVSKGVKGKVEGRVDATEAPTVKGGEALATSGEVAKNHAAKLDKSHSQPKEVVAEQEVTPAACVTSHPQTGDEGRAKENDVQEKTECIAAPKTETILAAFVDQKDNAAATAVPQLTPQPSSDAAADKAVAEAVVQAASGAEALVTAAAAPALREAPEIITPPSSLAQQASTSLSLKHRPEGEKIEIKVIPKATIADQPLTKIKVIANATVSDQHFTLSAADREASVDADGRQSLAVGRVPNSSSAPQLSTLGASGYSWKTNRIRRKLNDAIENTETMLPRLESEVQDLLREAEDYLAPERRARRSWTPTFPRIITRGSCPALAARRARSHGEDEDEVFEDALDPSQLDTLMPLPDVQAERERRSRSRTPMEGPERSPSNNSMVAQAEALLSETDRLLRRSRSDKSLRRSYSRSLSSAALNKLAEVTADLSEEHNTAHLAGERLEAEQAERMKLEKEVERLQNNMRMMSTANGKLEMEKQALQSEVLNGEAEHDEEEAADASLYRRKYEWCLREIEVLKKQLKQQQEDDLDHLLLLKKQLEKKVADAYEETEEQRQVVAQVKRKSQRIQAEMNDLKILLEEQTSRNNLLEKKQRKFDQDMMAAQEELRHERTNKEKVQREKDQILSEKYSFEQEVATLKLELELKEEKLTALNRQLEDLNFTGKSEEEVAVLKKAKHDLELRVKDQEEELDDLAGQVQMLEGAKVRLEMSIEQMRKENRREVSQREEELEEVRLSAQKKVKALESQLENEHEERTLLVREKHELERRVSDLQDRNVGQVDEEYVHKLKKELKKTKALLRDTQTMLEKSQSEGGQKLLVRQLKTQLEDAEFAKTAAIKARQCAEADLSDLTSQMEEAQRSRKEAEDRCARIGKERAEIQTQLEESEEEVAEVMKKYKSVVSQLSVDQITLSEQTQQIAELEHEKQVLHERLLELSSKVEVLEGETANIHTQRRLELKIKEVESKLELEQTTRQRLESQIGRLKDQLERVTGDCDSARLKEAQAVEQNKRVARQLRDAKEDLATLQQRHTDAVNKKSEMEKQLELADSEVATLKSDLKLAFKRIEDLQQAIQGDLNDSDSDLSDSDSDSDGSLSSYLTASLKQQMSSSNSTLRTPPSEVHQLDRAEQPTSPCSEAISEDLEEAAATRESFA